MITLFVRGLEAYAYHGVGDAEQSVGHRYVMDLELDLDAPARQSDRIEETVDYGEVSQWLVQSLQTTQNRTLEHLAQRLGEALLERYPSVRRVHLSVAKRLPPAPIIADLAGVRVSLER